MKNTLCLNCSSRLDGQVLPCSFCGSVLPRIAVGGMALEQPRIVNSISGAAAVGIGKSAASGAADLATYSHVSNVTESAPNAPDAKIVPISNAEVINSVTKTLPSTTEIGSGKPRGGLPLVVGGFMAVLVVGVGGYLMFGAKSSNAPPSSDSRAAVPTHGPVGATAKSPDLTAARPTAPMTSTPNEVSAPKVQVGDTYAFETLDAIEPKLNNVTYREIVEVNSSGFVMTIVNAKSKFTRRLTYDKNLNLLSTRSGDNDGVDFRPALQYFRFPLKTGDGWSASSTETNIKTGKTRTHQLRTTVGGLEQVTVPAGTFSAYRITIQSELNDAGQISTGQDISWYSPDARRTVRSELESRDATGKIGRRTVNLVSYGLR